MTTIALPAWLKAQSLTPPTIQRSVMTSVGRYSQAADIGDLMSGDTWVMSIGVAPMSRQDAPRMQALVNRLVGGLNLLSCHDLGMPIPQGSLRGAPTLSATMALGSQTMQVANASNGNLLLSSRSLDSGNWARVGLSTVTANANTDPDGAVTSDHVVEDTTTGNHGVFQSVTIGANAQPLTFSCCFTENGRNWAVLQLTESLTAASCRVYFDIRNGVIGSTQFGGPWVQIGISIQPMARVGWFRCVMSVLKNNAATGITATILGASADGVNSYAGNGTGTFNPWAARLELAATAGTYGLPDLKAGDMLGAGNAIFQAADDTVFSDLGAGTLAVVNRARADIASGTVLVWNRPAALWRLVGTPQMTIQPGYANGLQLDLVEKAFT